MLKEVLVASFNPAKIADYTEVLNSYGIKVLTLNDLTIIDQALENHDTYEANAKEKALFYFGLSGRPTLADDGGFEIDYLNGEPGVRSRRWLASLTPGRSGLGRESTDQEIIEHLKKVIGSIPKDQRSGRFVNVLCLAKSASEIFQAKNCIEGYLVEDYRKDFPKGFPFRGFFRDKTFNKFLMDLKPEEYQQINHRRKNVEALIKYF